MLCHAIDHVHGDKHARVREGWRTRWYLSQDSISREEDARLDGIGGLDGIYLKTERRI
jgi:hypothetical protein